jgi:hypothetical protein
MTDFLGRLAARALGIAPLIQPRPRSRFEPEPALLLAGEAMTPADALRSVAAPPISPMQAAARATVTAATGRYPAQAAPPALPQSNREPLAPVRSEPAWQPQTPIEFSADQVPAASPRGRPQSADPPALGIAADPPAGTAMPQRAPAVPPAEPAPRQRDPEWAAKADPGPAERQAIPFGAPAGSAATAQPAADTPVAGIAPQAAPALRPPARARIPAAPAAVPGVAAEPDIVIEIGSIELRTQPAAPPAPAAAQIQRSGPALSLEVYLARRKAG